jgi:oxalate decarboxylase/phosphoglucose isomerase-like protein (cupin superfamily)
MAAEPGPIDPNALPTQTFSWGAIKWLVSPDATEGAGLTLGEVRLLPGQGHARHNHPTSEEVLYVLSGRGEQMLDVDGRERWFPVGAGDCIYVETAQFHSTLNSGWEPLRLLAIYNPGGAERALAELPDFKEVPPGGDAGWRVG